MQQYNNGHVIDVQKVPTIDYEVAAKEWAEGSKTLEELLFFCLKNNIVTQACCIGHKDEDMSFVQFELSERNKNAIMKILKRYYNLDGVNMTFLNQPGIVSKFAISVPQSIRDTFFKDMMVTLSNELKIEMDSLPLEMKSTLQIMLEHKIPNDYLEVQYSIDNNQKKLFVATNNAYYNDLYWDNENAIPWVDDSIGIEDSPENIIPIIEYISRKIPIVYSNRIESQRRINDQIYQELLSQQEELNTSNKR